ncbi:MAG: DNA-deoxyinosine glycosylase [Clostridia bacterium]|nr:DNA-deoxyinosine glycosylase [Clostridia bacterium]
MSEIKYGFAPVYDKDSQLLILGSFPSVKSRQVDFYYGNPQNRFWRTACGYFNEEVPDTTEGKREFLLRNKIALWDIVTECEIVGSQDSTIKNFKVADIKTLLQNSAIRFIILNGGKACSVFEANYGDIKVPYKKLPSTSPANTHFNVEEWRDVLSAVFGRA